MSDLDWRDYIHTNPEIMAGKPDVRGPRLSVEFILRLLAAGWSFEDLRRSYPTLTREGLQAVFALAADIVREQPISVNS